jgi:hypothetical protein
LDLFQLVSISKDILLSNFLKLKNIVNQLITINSHALRYVNDVDPEYDDTTWFPYDMYQYSMIAAAAFIG